MITEHWYRPPKALPAKWRAHDAERRIEAHGSAGSYIWLWPEHAQDILRVECARWAVLQRSIRYNAAFGAMIKAVARAGFAYAVCRGNCKERPCYWRYTGGFGAHMGDAANEGGMWLDCHVRFKSGAWIGYTDEGRDYSHEFEQTWKSGHPAPQNLALGEACYLAQCRAGVANTRKHAWDEHLSKLLVAKLTEEDPPTATKTARVRINSRNYWLCTVRDRFGSWYWRILLLPEAPSTEIAL